MPRQKRILSPPADSAHPTPPPALRELILRDPDPPSAVDTLAEWLDGFGPIYTAAFAEDARDAWNITRDFLKQENLRPLLPLPPPPPPPPPTSPPLDLSVIQNSLQSLSVVMADLQKKVNMPAPNPPHAKAPAVAKSPAKAAPKAPSPTPSPTSYAAKAVAKPSCPSLVVSLATFLPPGAPRPDPSTICRVLNTDLAASSPPNLPSLL
jgi:hypothetical protein